MLTGRNLRRAQKRRDDDVAAKYQDAWAAVLPHFLNLEPTAHGRLGMLVPFFEEAGVLSAEHAQTFRGGLRHGVAWAPDADIETLAATLFEYLYLAVSHSRAAQAVLDHFVAPLVEGVAVVRPPHSPADQERDRREVLRVWRLALLVHLRRGHAPSPWYAALAYRRFRRCWQAGHLFSLVGARMRRRDQRCPAAPLATRPLVSGIAANAPGLRPAAAVCAAGSASLI